MKVARVVRMASRTKTDAWVTISATQEVLEWFVENRAPAFALSRRFRSLPMAGSGPDKAADFRSMVRRLVGLGHHRIVMLQPDHMRIPARGLALREILDELESHGIQTGPCHFPSWEPTPEGLRRCLDSLFEVTPPTGLILDRPCEYLAAHQHLARQGVFTPRDVSLICTDDDLSFEWCEPSVSFVCWDSHPWVRRIVRWADNVASGKDDRRQTFTKAEFVAKGSIGATPKECVRPRPPDQHRSKVAGGTGFETTIFSS